MATHRSKGYVLALGALLSVGVAFTARGQVIPGLPYGGSLEAYAQSWDIDEGATSSTISQTFVPINIFLPIADGFEAKLSSAYVSMTRDTDLDGSETVSGLADLKFQASGTFLQRRLVIGLVANLPSGEGELTSVEQDIVFDFVAPDLSVRANRFGEGFNVGGTVSFANALSQEVTLGLGTSVLNRGAYDTALPNSSASVNLKPGLESRTSATIDVVSGASQFRLSSMIAIYGTERVNNVDNYKIGQELTIAADYMVGYTGGRGQLSVGVLELLRFDNSVRLNGSFGTEETSTNGNYMVVHGSNDYSVSPKLRVTLSALGRLVGTNKFDAGDATVLEGGLAATFVPTSNVAFTLGGRYVSGSGTSFSGRDRDIKGLEGLFRTVVQLDR